MLLRLARPTASKMLRSQPAQLAHAEGAGSFALRCTLPHTVQATHIVLKQSGSHHAPHLILWFAATLTLPPGGPMNSLLRRPTCAATCSQLQATLQVTPAAAAAACCCRPPSLQPELRSAAAMRRLKAVFFGETHCSLGQPTGRMHAGMPPPAADVPAASRRRSRLISSAPLLALKPNSPPDSPDPPPDLDDTLVLTEDCDRAAFACVAQLAEELLPGCNGRRLVNEWRPLFHASPWCPEGKVRPLGEVPRCCSAVGCHLDCRP